MHKKVFTWEVPHKQKREVKVSITLSLIYLNILDNIASLKLENYCVQTLLFSSHTLLDLTSVVSSITFET